jgi:hypothetical protein
MGGTTRGRGRRTAVAGALTAIALAVTLGGCSGGNDAATTADGSGDSVNQDSGGGAAEAPTAEDGTVGTDGNGRSAGDGDATSARVLPGDRDIVHRGRITVRVRDVARASGRAEDLVLQAGGVVFSQETTRDPRPRSGRVTGEAQLTLRVPPAEFAATLDGLGRLGRELSRSRSAQDVTTELADTGSRVRSQQRSVDRMRTLLGEADTIGEVVQVEAELARREADLESLQAQLARLEDVTALATIEVSLLAPGQAAQPEEDDDLGFLTGLRNGWEAFVGVALVGLTVLGALLPFAAVVALLGVPAYLVLRGRRRAAVASPPPAATEA